MSRITKKSVATGVAIALCSVTLLLLLEVVFQAHHRSSMYKIFRQLSTDANVPQRNLDKAVCYDKGCLLTSLYILISMNGTTDPCDDFYEFACGRAELGSIGDTMLLQLATATAKILKNNEKADWASVQLAKEYFRQCVDFHSQTLAKEELEGKSNGIKINDAEFICLQIILKSHFAWAIGAKYLEEVMFDEHSKEVAVAVLDNLKETFAELVNAASWMSSSIKEDSIKKTNAMKAVIGYPDWIKNRNIVDMHFEGLQLGKTYNESTASLSEFESELAEEEEWSRWDTPTSLTAWYTVHNEIGIPATYLRKPFFDSIFPKFQTYSALGFSFGHEIMHGLNISKQEYHMSDIGLVPWLSYKTERKLKQLEECIANQYGKYCYNFTTGDTQCINGTFTQKENIADNGGLRISFKAYQNWVAKNGPELPLLGLEQYSPEQLFFISYASANWCTSETENYIKEGLNMDPHSPAKWRVNGVLKNSVDFARAFNCPIDPNGMNVPLAEKCEVW